VIPETRCWFERDRAHPVSVPSTTIDHVLGVSRPANQRQQLHLDDSRTSRAGRRQSPAAQVIEMPRSASSPRCGLIDLAERRWLDGSRSIGVAVAPLTRAGALPQLRTAKIAPPQYDRADNENSGDTS